MDQNEAQTPAERHYANHLKAVSKYCKTHPEKNREKSKRAYEKRKEDPEKYNIFLESMRQQYKEKKALKNNNKVD